MDISQEQAAVFGQDLDREISQPDQVVNDYAVLGRDAAAGSTALEIADPAMLPDLAPEDLLFVIEMQGATMDTLSDTADYGAVLDLGNAGRYEMVTVTGVNGSAVDVRGRGAGQGLLNDYAVAGRTQVIRVPQYQTLTITEDGSLTAPSWDGAVGGVVVVTADTVQVDGVITATGKGFRGGQRVLDGPEQAGEVLDYRGYVTTDSGLAAARGEGVAGSADDYDAAGGRYGRGAAANGGGGGSAGQSGGGGGANVSGLPAEWTGQGVMDRSTADREAAWRLDPAYDPESEQFAASSGGGRGGYGCSTAAADPTQVGPDDEFWGCSNRAEVGGLGGRPLSGDVTGRLFLGGGGGAGYADGENGGEGGRGGGLVFVLARHIKGSGRVLANGEPGGAAGLVDTTSGGPGGGGGGGAVVLMASESLSGVEVFAEGGAGGRHIARSRVASGGGGGGGGGLVMLVDPDGDANGAISASVPSGAAGITTMPEFALMPMNGATAGASGEAAEISGFSPEWLPPAHAIDLEVTLRDPTQEVGVIERPGYTMAPFSVTVTNLGPDVSAGARVRIEFPRTHPTVSADQAGDNVHGCQHLSLTMLECELAAGLATGESEVIDLEMALPKDPQGPFTLSAQVVGGGYEIDLDNNRTSLEAEVEGWVELSGGCSVTSAGKGPSGWLAMLAPLLLWWLRRRRVNVF